ncbi:TerC family protein [Corynebacterium amycolatum]|uniref:TerC family protein n=1 Tax=Corynebacterium amycolatum TaxID=43765 RepID=UPI000C7581F2|nr:TerC family protein [Corynebacterium amycolatum]MDK7316103.1 TerC family protein [Corynebacterium amycolatum]PKZ22650.1 tellurium resistance protein TerC [Corynebacterium amycolatum]
MHVPALVWIITIVVVMGFIAFDFYAHVRTPHNPTMKEAGGWTAFYVVLALIFGGMVWLLWDHHRGIEFLSGYITEKALSVDNLFVFALIIGAFKIPRQYQQKVLLFGIAMALVFRGLFIWAGAAVIAKWSDVFYLFAIFLIYTAIKTVYDEAVDKPEPDPSDMKLIQWLRRIVPISDHYNRDKLTVKENGKRYLTPLAIALVSIGFIDVMFAFDSIPAIYGLTDEAYIVFTANALALMGLRQMYFLLDGLLDRLVYLAYGLGVILAFIGVKLLLHALHENNLPFINGGENVSVPEVSTWVSLAVIVIVLVVTVLASWLKIKRDENMGAIALPRVHHDDHGNDDGLGSHASSTSVGERSASAGNETNGSRTGKNEPGH